MNEKTQKINQIIQALQMQEQVSNPSGMGFIMQPVIIGDNRTKLINELVLLLTEITV